MRAIIEGLAALLLWNAAIVVVGLLIVRAVQ